MRSGDPSGAGERAGEGAAAVELDAATHAAAWDAGWCAGVAALGRFDGFPDDKKVNPYEQEKS